MTLCAAEIMRFLYCIKKIISKDGMLNIKIGQKSGIVFLSQILYKKAVFSEQIFKIIITEMLYKM